MTNTALALPGLDCQIQAIPAGFGTCPEPAEGIRPERVGYLSRVRTELAMELHERRQAEEELRIRARQQAVVAELGQRALAGIDLAALMDAAVELVAETLHVEYSKVLELLPDGEALLLRAGVGWQEGWVGRATVSAGLESQAGYTLLSSEPVIVEDLSTETRFSGPPLLNDHGVVSGISAAEEISGYSRQSPSSTEPVKERTLDE